MTDTIETKSCIQCKAVKSACEFYRNRTKADGLQNMCKVCTKANDQSRAPRRRQPDRIAAWRNRRRLSAEQDPQKLSALVNNVKRWRRNHYVSKKQTIIARINRNRAMRAGAPGQYSEGEWRLLRELFGNVCLACGQKKRLSVDHVIAISRGGHNSIRNLQPLCKSCNSRKGVQAIDYRLRSKVVVSPLNTVGEQIYGS